MYIYILSLNLPTNITSVSEPVRKEVCRGTNTGTEIWRSQRWASTNVNKMTQSVSPSDKTRLSLMTTNVFFPDSHNTMTYSTMPFPLFLLQCSK